MSKQLILENVQAPGDSLMFTCAIRDLHKQYPNEFRTCIRTKCPDIWRNNPLVHNADRNKDRVHHRVGYSTSINSSNQRAGHFCTGFARDMSERLGIKIKPTDMRPDVYLTDEEKDPENRRVKRPYWIVVAGGKADFTAKIWDPKYWQQTVDTLREEDGILPVQVGSASHMHPKLAGVKNLVGKTRLRDLLCLVYHAEGVICPVTCTMHMAAAFNKPCVVVAGGREAWWWEAYTRATWATNILKNPVPKDFVDHTFIHTIGGTLDCCKRQGCWRSGVGERKNPAKNCKRLVVGPSGKHLPECLRLITPDQVVAGVRRYLNGEKIPIDPVPKGLRPPMFTEALPKVRRPIMLPPGPKPKLSRVVRRARRGRGHINRRRFIKEVPKRRTTPTNPAPPKPPKPPRTIMKKMRKRPQLPERRLPPVALNMAPGAAPFDRPLKGLRTPVTICVLLYGDFPALSQRCLQSIYQTVDPSLFELRLGLNAVSARVRRLLDHYIVSKGNVRLYEETANIYKYPLMRKMFYKPGLDSRWVIWFDDDSHAVSGNWLAGLDKFVTANPGAKMVGKKYFYHLTPGQLTWIKEAKWYKGKPQRTRRGMPKTDFLTGGWWAMRTSAVKRLHWPDPRISHNGGDVMLGEACYQNDIMIQQFYNGVRISDYVRRGASQKHPGR